MNFIAIEDIMSASEVSTETVVSLGYHKQVSHCEFEFL
jgi:hypothetical protein